MPDVRDNRDAGMRFEEEWAEDMGLQQVPGSGNQWHMPMDSRGLGVRWSLKFTQFKAFPVDRALIDECVEACEGPGGTGETPMWGIRLGEEEYDLVIMRKSDAKRLFSDPRPIAVQSKAEARREAAGVPILMREDPDE